MTGNVPWESYSAPIDFRIPQTPPSDLDPKEVPPINDLFFFAQQVIAAFINFCGIGPQLESKWAELAGNPRTLLAGNLRRFYAVAAEAINFGAPINLFNSAGTLKIRNANATDHTKQADGFCSTVGGIANTAAGEVILGCGTVTIAGLTVGQRYYLSTISGDYSTVPAVAAGNLEQYLGIAITTTTLWYNQSSTGIQH